MVRMIVFAVLSVLIFGVYAQPKTLKTMPMTGATEVALDIGQLTVVFDQAMRTDSYSVLRVPGKPFPPLLKNAAYWPKPTIFLLRLGRLEPNTAYYIQLNSTRHRGFRSANKTILPPTVLYFRTVARHRLNSIGPQQSFVGRWQFVDQQKKLLLDIRADRTFCHIMTIGRETEQTRGRYSLIKNTIIVYPQGEAPERFTYSMPNGNTLLLTDSQGESTRLRRIAETIRCNTNNDRPYTIEKKNRDKQNGHHPALFCSRVWEPREKAFSFLLPHKWQMRGGIFRVDPTKAGGPGNSVVAKCDLIISKDSGDSVYLHLVPSYNYAQMPASAPAAGMFPPGSTYQGMMVKPMPRPQEFLQELLSHLHPKATRVQILKQTDYSSMTHAYQQAYDKGVNQMLAGLGIPGYRFYGGAMAVEYDEDGVRYRALLATILADKRSGEFSWSNEHTWVMRAPAKDADSWKAVLEIIANSIELNANWLLGELKGQKQRARTVVRTMKEIQRIDREINRNHQHTNSEIEKENYLMLTDQEDYVNPYSGKVERDTSLYSKRWISQTGQYIYSNDPDYNPNQDQRYFNVEWKPTPVRR